MFQYRFYSFFNDSINDIFPTSSSVTHIVFGEWFNQQVDHLPSTLTHLLFGATFNKPTPLLPQSLLHLTYGKCFNQPLINLPEGMKPITCLLFPLPRFLSCLLNIKAQ